MKWQRTTGGLAQAGATARWTSANSLKQKNKKVQQMINRKK